MSFLMIMALLCFVVAAFLIWSALSGDQSGGFV